MRMTEEAWLEVIETNLSGAFWMTKAVTRPMLKARAGRIVNITSVSGQAGQMGQANYSSAKAGLIGLTKATARELASRGITVNAVAPGFVLTELTQDLPEPLKDEITARTPLGRFGTTEEIAERRRVPRLGRGRLHHRPGARRRRRPRDDVTHRLPGADGRVARCYARTDAHRDVLAQRARPPLGDGRRRRDRASPPIVDPRRDVDLYLEAAAAQGLRITAVLETHLHNDYVSGGRDLAALTGATHAHRRAAPSSATSTAASTTTRRSTSGGSGSRRSTRPGTRPSTSPTRVARHDRPDEPVSLFSGGSLLVGAVGRTDLLGAGERRPVRPRDVPLAPRRDPPARRRRRTSIPTHGAGSLCSTGIGDDARRRRSAPSAARTRCSRRWTSTPSPAPCSPASRPSRATSRGCARRTRAARRSSAVGVPDAAGPRPGGLRGGHRGAAPRSSTRVRPAAHVAGHIPGSLSIPLDESFGTWLGWVVGPRPAGRPRRRERRPTSTPLMRQAIRIGRDEVAGVLVGLDAWRASGRPVEAGGRDLDRRARPRARDRRRAERPTARHRRPPGVGVRERARPGRLAHQRRIAAGPPRRAAARPADRDRSARPGSGPRSRPRCCGRPGSTDVAGSTQGVPAWQAAGHPVEIGRRCRIAAPVLTRRAGTSVRAALGTTGRPVGAERGCHHRPVSVRPSDGKRGAGAVRVRVLPRAPLAGRAVALPATARRRRGDRARIARSSSDRSLELELAERLDTVLGIAERLAASHDREDLFRMIVDETRRALRADATTIRILRDDRLEVAAWAGLPTDVAADLPDLRRDEGWVGEVLRTGRVLAFPDVRADPAPRRALDDGRRRASPATSSPRSSTTTGSSASLAAMTYEPRDWTSGDVAFITTLATHAAIALTNAELFEQTEARAAQLARGPGGLGPAEPCRDRRGRRPDRRRGDAPDHRLPQRPGLPARAADDVVPIAFAGTVGAYEQVDFALLRTKLGEGFTGWVALHGEPLLIDDANLDPRGQNIPGTDDVDESMLVVPMRYDQAIVGVITLSKLGLGQFDADDLRLLGDPRRPGGDGRRVGPAAGADPGPRRRAAAPARHERRAVREPRPAAGRQPDGRAPRQGDGRRRVRHQLLGPRRPGRVDSLGYYPLAKVDEMEP